MPARIHDLVRLRAQGLGREVAADDLFLLALTELDEADPAGRALAAEDVSAERVLPGIRTSGDGPIAAPAGLTFAAPAYYSSRAAATDSA